MAPLKELDAGPISAALWVNDATMGTHKELRRQGYEFDHDYGDLGDRTELWVNRRTNMGIPIEWFRLPEVTR